MLEVRLGELIATAPRGGKREQPDERPGHARYTRHRTFCTSTLALWALSALAHTMPVPDGKSGKGYQWVYNLLQFLLANLGRVRSSVAKPADPAPPGS